MRLYQFTVFVAEGTTGTMVACKSEGLTVDGAIQNNRRLKPGSVETKDQEDRIGDFYRHCKSKEAERQQH
ncbi:hypothetical protein BSL78_29707 [Apostichopus japonicus]|uniref:Uncharacterized protein n=1 Tax=Stichopus japonicus TaxID=307972 RepID=A0A2G8JCL1_STIJA|nr:hypothetical protein BSL78_29707 [Apostichopus japonicus]